jgi:putative glycosyltransferase (exosortase G-associated)
MTEISWVGFIFFWGVWIIIPFIVDVAASLRDSLLVWLHRREAKPYPLPHPGEMPKVSVVIPAYNEQLDIDRCITSLKAQSYPHYLIEVIVIDDGSTDRTGEVVNGHINGNAHWNGHIRLHNRVIPARDFGGVMSLVEGSHQGKPAAVNLGLRAARGEIIMAIDSDVVLEPEAIAQAVAAFHHNPDMMAATAHLIIDPNLLVEADEEGHISLDENDMPISRRLNILQRFLTGSQFFEYLQSFRIGRHSEAIRKSLFTLSGACAIFRRDALFEIRGYRGRTVSEDTDATLTLQRADQEVGYLPQVRVHIAPTIDLFALYAQRLRWQRGQIEVMAVNTDLLGGKNRFWAWTMPRRLQNDHALALLRLVWGFILPLFPLLGYDPVLLGQATILMFMMYIITDFILLAAAWPSCAESERRMLRIFLVWIPVVPFYRVMVYFFRLSGILKSLSDDPAWTVKSTWSIDFSRVAKKSKVPEWIGNFVSAWSD